MKKLLLIIITLVPVAVFAQKTSGEILFEEKIEMNIESNLTEEEKAEMAQFGDFFAQLGDMKNERKLLFTTKHSLFKNDNGGDKQKTIGSEDGGMQIMAVVASPEEITYQNFEEGKIIEQKEFMQKKFLLNYDMKSSMWKVSGEQKEILGYPCQKAILNDTAELVEAWFTMQIPVPSGPASFGQLPGMILEVALDSGKIVYTATDIQFRELSDDEIEIPKKGKKVSPEEFEQIVAKKTKEMEDTYGREGAHTIEIRIGE